MKNYSDSRRRSLHLVTSAAAAREPDDKLAYKIAEGVLKFQTLQDEFDEEAFSAKPDMQHIGQLVLEMGVLRERLAAHGVKV